MQYGKVGGIANANSSTLNPKGVMFNKGTPQIVMNRPKKYSKRFFKDNMHHKTYNDLYGVPNQVENKPVFDPANY